MKKALLILAIPLVQLATAQAHAGDNALTSTSTKTRAEVREEVKAAARSGELSNSSEAGPATILYRTAPTGTLTRLQVKEVTKAAARAGELPKAGENANVDAIDIKSDSTRSRAEVKAETRQAIMDKAFVNSGTSYAGN